LALALAVDRPYFALALPLGYEIRMTGRSPFARYGGVSTSAVASLL
jgi:ABC-type uncharacterized transport system permease subunit